MDYATENRRVTACSDTSERVGLSKQLAQSAKALNVFAAPASRHRLLHVWQVPPTAALPPDQAAALLVKTYWNV